MERRVGDAWVLVANNASGSSKTTTLNGLETFRLWDGAGEYFVDVAWFTVGGKFAKISDVAFSVPNAADAITSLSEGGIMFVGNGFARIGENFCLYLKVRDPITGTWYKPNQISSISATVYKTGLSRGRSLGDSNYFIVGEERSIVSGWNGVAPPTSLLLESPVSPEDWDDDEETTGFNFYWTPNDSSNPLFTETGTYQVKLVFNLVGGGRLVFAKDVEVV